MFLPCRSYLDFGMALSQLLETLQRRRLKIFCNSDFHVQGQLMSLTYQVTERNYTRQEDGSFVEVINIVYTSHSEHTCYFTSQKVEPWDSS
jgi:hypothetical protein